MAAERQDQAQGKTPGSGPPGPAEKLASEERLWARFAESSDPAIREELIRRYLPFAKSLTQRYRGVNESFDDLLQVASLALVKAVDRFDPARGIPFTAFASPTILGELKRHFRDRVWTVRVPRGLHDRMGDVEKAIGELTEELQRSPSVGEIAEKLEIEPDRHPRGRWKQTTTVALSRSIVRPAKSEDEAPASESIGEEDQRFELVEGKAALEGALPQLDERERLVLRLRFTEDMTQSQIAERIGHSQMHVSRILRGALQRIREQVEKADEAEAGG